MYTLFRLVSHNRWGSFLVGVLAVVLGAFSLAIFFTGQTQSSYPIRYLLIGVFFIGVGIASVANAAKLMRQQRIA